MADTPIGHGDRDAIRRVVQQVALDDFPNVENLPSSERTDEMDAFNENGIVQRLPDGAWVVFDAFGKLFGGEVCL